MTSAAPRLSATNVSIQRGGQRIVHDADLVLNAGELTILAGTNGAGKTTLARAIAGLSRFDGKILLNGVAIEKCTAREKAKALAYAEREGLHYEVELSPMRKFVPKSYSDNFRFGRAENWTH